MRHRVAGRQLSRNSSHREAMFRNIVLGLLTLSGVAMLVSSLPRLLMRLSN